MMIDTQQIRWMKAIGKIEDAIGAVSTDQLGPDIRKALNMG